MKTRRLNMPLDERSFSGPVVALCIGALLIVSALFFGMLATTADPMTIGLGLGLVGGAFLLAAPRLVIWLVLVLSLATGALISFAGPAYSKLPWVVSLLTFLLWPMALLHLAHQKRIPLFIWLAIALVLEAVLITVVQWYSAAELTAGFKRYFQGYGLLFALAALPFLPADVRRWQHLLIGIALLQLPFAMYEFFVLVPIKGGLAAGSEVTDVVAGSFGANMEGGNASSEMAAFLLIALAFLVARWRAGLIGTRRFAVLATLCFLPLGLGETKIAIVLLPIMGVILLHKDFIRSPLRYLPGLLVIAGVTAGLGYVYLTFLMNSNLDDVIEGTLRYNVGSMGYGANLLNRSTVLSFWWSHHGWDDPFHLLFGHGLGSAFWLPVNPVVGHVAIHYQGYGIDGTTASTLLWETGIIGMAIYASMLIAAWLAANRLWRTATDAATRADALAIQAAIAVFMVFIYQSNSSVNLLQFEIIIAFVLGYLAYLLKTTDPDFRPHKPARSARFRTAT